MLYEVITVIEHHDIFTQIEFSRQGNTAGLPALNNLAVISDDGGKGAAIDHGRFFLWSYNFV